MPVPFLYTVTRVCVYVCENPQTVMLAYVSIYHYGLFHLLGSSFSLKIFFTFFLLFNIIKMHLNGGNINKYRWSPYVYSASLVEKAPQ